MSATKTTPIAGLFVEDDELPRTLQPQGWPRPHGYANGMSAKGRVIVTGGMIGCDVMENVVDGFVAQVRLALINIRAVLAEGGAGPEHIVRLTWYVVDMEEYRASRKELGHAYREVLGAHYPAMAVVGVKELFEPKARVEIEATAVVP
jgi:enamine deaminase RidA (YjgF/YER057c/UK114 family)